MLVKKIFLSLALALILPVSLYAEDTHLVHDTETFQKAVVLDILSSGQTSVIDSGVQTPIQTIKVQILEGAGKNETIEINNDYTQLSKGDVFYAHHIQNKLDGTDIWSVSDPYRLDILGWLAVLFVVLIFVFGGIQGVRGLVSLIGSFILIFYLLIPGIYNGYSAVAVSIAVSSLIIIVGSYVTHGFNRTTSSAVVGMIVTVLITGLGAYLVVHSAHLSGYTSEENTYLNLDTKGSINMVGLLFGGLIIGLLGVLYDIAIGQAVAIEELYRAGTSLSRRQVYVRGIRIGREHIGALVNTLAIAYVGASLPLLLLIQSSTMPVSFIINNEIFATEIVRILIGSIGLILGVPITTYIASHMLYGRVVGESKHTHHH
jgi:uncharacterized membrane protein